MIYYQNEDIRKTNCTAIIHGCNAQGKMASGVAKAIRDKWPEAYESYMSWGYYSGYRLGDVIFTKTDDGKTIGNLITQENYGYDGKTYANEDAIRIALQNFVLHWKSINEEKCLIGYPPIASSKIGCGLGGLKWEDVSKIYEEISKEHNIDFVIYDNNRETVK